MAGNNRYAQIIERLFLNKYKAGEEEVGFEREDIARVAAELGIALPKNLGDLVYTFLCRNAIIVLSPPMKFQPKTL